MFATGKPTQTSRTIRAGTAAVLGSALLLFAFVPGAAATPATGITVAFTADDKGFTANSDKDISNIIVELCDGTNHKHDGLTGHTFVHTETQRIAGVWVKSGNNGIGGDAPPGAGERFDNAGVDCTPPPPTCPTGDSRLTQHSYLVNGVTHFSDMTGNIHSGDLVRVDFTVAPGCTQIQLSLVAYQAPSATFSAATADQQTVFDSETGFFNAGAHSMDVNVPGCYFQTDFVFGAVIAHLGPANSGNFYSDQGRLIDADNGGTHACPPVPPTTTCAAQADGVHVTWNAVTGATSYRVWRQVGSGPWTSLATTAATSYVDGTAAVGQSYQYAVSAIGPGGESARGAFCTIASFPVFPSAFALAAGTIGALGSALVILRRRKGQA